MPDNDPHTAPNSVGIVEAQTYHFDDRLTLACGKILEEYDLVVETYGTLNAQKSNAVLICHALSGNHHAAGKYTVEDKKAGWWDHYIGPGKPLDTDRFFIVSINNLGGCHGSTGPKSINPANKKAYGAEFPPLRVRDWVHSQARLADTMGIDTWAAVVGGSLGGMQAMRWALEYPERIRHCVIIASAMKLTAQNIAFNETARQAILSDPEYHNGDYIEKNSVPKNGLSIARMIGHITYLSGDGMGERFGRDLKSGSFDQGADSKVEFEIESYLRYQGENFSQQFDANTYVLMTRALDYFDLAREYDHDAAKAFSHALCDFFVVSFKSDWRFAPERSREIVNALMKANKNVAYTEIDSPYGHDAFLVPNQQRYWDAFSLYMKKIPL